MSDAPITSIAITPPRGWAAFADIIKTRWFQLSTLILYALVLNREGDRVPSGNELVYQLYVYKAWHPHFLAGDWTFTEPTAGHGFFNWTVGWLTLFLPITSALSFSAWVGRFACWALTFVALLRLGRHFKITPVAVWIGILLWLTERQALPATALTEWVIGSFEAKCPAYICLLFALDTALCERVILAGLLAGLSFSFHSAVGLWGGAAMGWMIMTHSPIRKTIQFSACAIATALPGLVSSLPLVLGSHSINSQEAKFLLTKAEPLCLDPFAMAWPYVAVLILMLGFAGLVRWTQADRTASKLWQFELGLGAIFVSGFIARWAGLYNYVELFPTRVFTVLIPLFFFWQLCWILVQIVNRRGERPMTVLAAIGLFIFLAIPSPVGLIADSISSHLHLNHGPPADPAIAADEALESTPDFRAAAAWVAANTPTDAVVITPPWRSDAFYYTRRPLIVDWDAFRYDAMTEWRRRLERLTGDLSDLTKDDFDLGLRHRTHFRNLTVDEMRSIQLEFKASWLITTTDYPFERTYVSGPFKVYRLPAAK